ncbi:hypothetical protein DIS18_10510 [Algibacter marinivivus]|uniref:Outer membrane protein beta-barrel domain-containing protein n=1 Tax=Algibacter marinivivus TaxID=2100723 RepID=A0A2U2X4F1_9FLAO|nr:DUF6048 family protein [Algibacter marinivivus]PWH82661.1 hypothetical protein DIS18_10510 [Algibacter marinivivus]
MKQQHTLTLRISNLILMLFICVFVNAQNDSIPETIDDSNQIKLKYGLRLGGDIGKLIRTSLDDDYTGFEIMADYRLKEKLYIAGEIGFEEKNTINDYLNITTKGSYIKGGIDFNMYQNWLNMDNMIYAGFRVGASTFSHDLNSFQVYSIDQYWAPQLTSDNKQELTGLTAFWAEIILGLKAEIFNNLYMGLNVQLKISASQTIPNNFDNVYIPGFGKTYDSSGIGAGYSYFLAYRIPLYKKAK